MGLAIGKKARRIFKEKNALYKIFNSFNSQTL